MTSPNGLTPTPQQPVSPTPTDPVTYAQSLAAGNDHLVATPQLLGGLMAANATAQQAQAVNQFIAGNKSQSAANAINAPAPKKKGWSLNPLKDVGRVWHDATHNPVMDGLGKAMNFTNSAATLSLQAITSNPTKFQNRMSEEMRAVGYDPNNFFSSAAYLASGRANLDLNDLYENYDEGQVNKAIQVANMTKEQFDQATAADPSLSALTQTKNFQILVDQVNARRATFGNWVLEPANPKQDVGGKERQFTAGAIDTVVSLKLDPTLIAGESYKTYKLSKIAVGGVSGGEKAYQILSDTGKLGAGAQVRTGFQSLIDNTKAMREASDAGNDAALAAAQARVNQLTPGLKHLVPDFIGAKKAVGVGEDGSIIWGAGAPIENMGQAAEYISSKEGMVRLFAGRAPSEAGLMPGQLSRLGARQVRAAAVGAAIKHGVTKQAAQRAAKLAQIDLRKPGVAGRIIPSPDDRALVHSGEDLSEAELAKGTGGLSSQDRATASRLGDATYALRGGGTVSHRIMQSLAPGAASARFKLAAQRWTSYLNKSSTIDITDPAASEQIFRASNMYMTRSDAYLAQAKYNLADEGTRKAIAHGVALQSLHAAGLGTSQAGRDYIAKFDNEFTDNKYSVTAGTFADPVTGEQVDRALFPSQIQNKVTLPTFSELQQHAAKLGIAESTVGTILNSKRVDALLKVTRLGWITNFSNAVRNSGEDLVGAWARGELGDVMRARAAAAELGLLPSKTKFGQRVASLAPIARTMQFYRHALTATSGEGGSVASALGLFVRDATIGAPSEKLGLKYLHSLDPEEMREKAKDYINLQQSSMIDPGGSAEMQKISNDGFIPVRLKMKTTNGYKPQSTEALEGAQRYANTLASVYNGNKELADKILAHVADPSATTLDDVVSELRNDKRLGKMTRATVYRNPATKVDVRASTDAEKDEAHRQLAQKQVDEIKYLTQGKDGVTNQKLVDYLKENGKAPNARWIQDNVQDELRPENVLAPVWEAVPRTPGTAGMLEAIADLGGKGYQAIVEKPITRWSTMPIFLANYGKERAAAEAWEKTLVDGGLSAKAADHAAQEIGMDAAWNRTMKYIDDPGLRTQMDVVGRNFFAFQRATTAFIRRWSTQLVEDPTRARKLMLAYEGAISTGFLYTDANGQKQFVFPGSGAAIDAITHVSSLIPGLNIPYIPGAMPNLTSQFAFLNPGLQNPMQFSLTPIANIPLHVVEKLNPNHREAIDSVDTFLNGTQGQGQSFASQFEPTALKKFTDALNGDDKDSMMADATRRAMLNLSAAGQLPGQKKDANGNIIPATDAEKQKFITNLQTQVRNQLLLRAVFGFVAPAAPSQPTEETDDSKADWFFAAQGVHGLDDEFKGMINDLGYDQAIVRWNEIHPDKLMYTQSTSVSTSKSATIQATQKSQQWLEANAGFMKDYSGVGAYFVPKADQTGDFDLAAYNAEFEMGLRQHKDTKDFYNDVVNANASALFFQSIDARNAMIQENPDNASQIKKNFSAWEADFYSVHPGYQASTAQDFTSVQNTGQDQIAQLRDMVKDPNLPSDVPRDLVKLMVDSYDNYHALIGQYPGQTDAATAQRQQISAGYNAWMQQFVKTHPDLGGLFTGVFRSVDPQVLDPIGSAT